MAIARTPRGPRNGVAPASGPPRVQLGNVVQGGLAPAFLAVVERGILHRPALAAAIEAEIELSPGEEHPPVRIVFGERTVLIEDGAGHSPDLRIIGSLPDLVSLMVAPLVRGVPTPTDARGRAALGLLALGRVRFHGRFVLVRRFLALIRV